MYSFRVWNFMSHILGWRVTPHICALHNAKHPPFATLNVTRNRNFQMQSKSLSKRCFTHHLVTKANYVVKPCDFQPAIYHKAYLGTLEASLSQWLVWNVVQRQGRFWEYIFFYNKISVGKGGTKQLLPSHKTSNYKQ